MDNLGKLLKYDTKSTKCVLILSNEDDHTTDDVIDWLTFMDVPVIRINGSEQIEFEYLEMSNNSSSIILNGHQKIRIEDIASFWYRRGRLNLKIDYINGMANKRLQKACNISIANEFTDLARYFYLKLEEIHGIGSVFENLTNKLFNLERASKQGFKIPQSRIITKKVDLEVFLKSHNVLLTKPIGQAGLIYDDESYSIDGTSTLFTWKDLAEIPNSFPPSLFQSYVDKAYELRIFFLENKCYCSAIFSQLDALTKVDFRNYNYEKPNRINGYTLPLSIESSLVAFMNDINMDSGSIDIIVTPQKEYYFLEVNPIGQFKQVSYPCNYYLEKKVAHYLAKPWILQ